VKGHEETQPCDFLNPILGQKKLIVPLQTLDIFYMIYGNVNPGLINHGLLIRGVLLQ